MFDIRLLLCNKSHWNHGYTCLVSNFVHRRPWDNFELRHPYAVNACIYKALGTLVIPMWKSSCFWILRCDDGKHWNAFVHDWVILSKFEHLFIRGKAKNNFFGSKDLSFSVVALRLNFVQPWALSVLDFCTTEEDNCSLCNRFYN